MGILYLVATPIGNLEDISARALRLLGQVKLIAAEDTRHTRKLLTHFDIATPLTSYHEHNKITKLDKILSALAEGDVALVSDAGMPALNDPGYELVKAALQAGYQVSPIPGPSAPVAALVASGLPTDAFLFLGYLPRKQAERLSLLGKVAGLPYTLVFLETPHRLVLALKDLLQALGDRSICVAREISKLHEEFFRGGISEALQHYSPDSVRGEITLVVAGNYGVDYQWDENKLIEAIDYELKNGKTYKEVTQKLASESGWSRRAIYQKALSRKDKMANGSG